MADASLCLYGHRVYDIPGSDWTSTSCSVDQVDYDAHTVTCNCTAVGYMKGGSVTLTQNGSEWAEIYDIAPSYVDRSLTHDQVLGAYWFVYVAIWAAGVIVLVAYSYSNLFQELQHDIMLYESVLT